MAWRGSWEERNDLGPNREMMEIFFHRMSFMNINMEQKHIEWVIDKTEGEWTIFFLETECE